MDPRAGLDDIKKKTFLTFWYSNFDPLAAGVRILQGTGANHGDVEDLLLLLLNF
jgi:hypothetical protein